MQGRRDPATVLAICGVMLTITACNGSSPRSDVAGGNAASAPSMPKATPSPVSILRPAVQKEIEASTPPPPVAPILRVVRFAAGGEIDDTGRRTIDDMLGRPIAASDRFVLRGHSDSRGQDGDNRAMSRVRAEAVRDYLVKKGIAADRIESIALGEDRPVAPNSQADGSDDPEGRARNRRVEIEIVPAAPDDPPGANAAPAEEAGQR